MGRLSQEEGTKKTLDGELTGSVFETEEVEE